MAGKHFTREMIEKEILDWAYNNEKQSIPQDWDLIISNWEQLQTIYKLATDDKCKKRDFFLRCLYILIGNEIHGCGVKKFIPRFDVIKEMTRNCTDERIVKWRERVEDLIMYRTRFDCGLWCDWGHVRGYEQIP